MRAQPADTVVVQERSGASVQAIKKGTNHEEFVPLQRAIQFIETQSTVVNGEAGRPSLL